MTPRQMPQDPNETPVTVDDLTGYVEHMNSIRDAGGSKDMMALFVVAQRHSGNPAKAHAVYLRMTALALLVKSGEANAWTLPPSEDGGVYTQDGGFRGGGGTPAHEARGRRGLGF